MTRPGAVNPRTIGRWVFFGAGATTFTAAIAFAAKVCIVCAYPAQVAAGS